MASWAQYELRAGVMRHEERSPGRGQPTVSLPSLLRSPSCPPFCQLLRGSPRTTCWEEVGLGHPHACCPLTVGRSASQLLQQSATVWVAQCSHWGSCSLGAEVCSPAGLPPSEGSLPFSPTFWGSWPCPFTLCLTFTWLILSVKCPSCKDTCH